MPVKFKNREIDPDDKYDEGWRRYGDVGADALSKDSGIRSISMITTNDGIHTLSIIGDPSVKSDGYVASQIEGRLKAAGINAEQGGTGNTVSFKVVNTGSDAIIKAAEALSGKAVGNFHPMLDEKVAQEIITSEKKLLVDSVIEKATGKPPAVGGRTNV